MIEVSQLSKMYKIADKKPGLMGAVQSLFRPKFYIKQAVENISFSIQKGELVGYIGANGAGKSTTIKMLSGIMTPSSGEVLVNGIEPYKNRQKNAGQIGAVFGQRTQLFWDIPVRESYELLMHIYKVPPQQFKQNLEQFVETLGLSSLLGIPVRQLSLGQKMRCELAAAFLHDPSVVFLDEPTIGLDISVKSKIRYFIREMNRTRGTTVILTTHDMQDIEEIVNRIIILDQGKILYDGDTGGIKEDFGNQRVIDFDLTFTDNDRIPIDITEFVSVIQKDPSNGKITLSFNNGEITAAEVIARMMSKFEVHDLSITDTRIEDIVKRLYEREAS
ncbi:ABC transporter ATP-binding protein [Paenibacillus sp. MMS18-CY102]|uniref:ABC transporter ATP-binding protein n=1 Tax=Paenibacillus sp. MMS18-CY102 TaxID=2682849 RepID=UPI0013659561|nr:ATP-binding cassette domain-containing protein [Paenibacillus sp. MMS18-CY102]MWC27596.1 ATP-binding cassette domain-containing protein [Paenibacillus sp. MMS18-CY102]